MMTAKATKPVAESKSSTARKLLMAVGGIALVLLLLVAAGAIIVRNWGPAADRIQYSMGQKLLDEENYSAALEAFKRAIKLDAEQPEYYWSATEAAFRLGNRKEAAKYAQQAWDRGYKSNEAISMMVELSDLEGGEKLDYSLTLASEVISEAIERQGINQELRFRNARLMLAQGRIGEALETLEGIVFPKRRTKQPPEESASETPPESAQHQQTSPDSDTGTPEKTTVQYLAPEQLAFVRQRARIYTAYLYFMQVRAGSTAPPVFLRRIAELEQRMGKNGEQIEAEALLYNVLRDYNELSEGERIEQIIEVLDDSGGHSILALMLARAYMENGQPARAVSIYRGLFESDMVLACAPFVATGYAYALTATGETDQALMQVRWLHSRNMFSKLSLSLYRELALKKDMLVQGRKAQDILEKTFPEDFGVKWAGGMMALNTGALDEAKRVFNELVAQYPDQAAAEMSRISVYLAGKQFETVLEECNKSKVSDKRLAPLRARAHLGLGNLTKAAQAYSVALQASSNPILKLDYANLLVRMQRLEQAAALYQELLKVIPDNPGIRLGLAYVLLRDGNPEEAKQQATVVLEAQGQSNDADVKPRARQLIAAAELATGNAKSALKQCSSIFEKNPDALSARVLQAIALRQLDRNDQAAAVFSAALQLAPENLSLRRLAAMALIEDGKATEGLALFHEAPAEQQVTTAFKGSMVDLLTRAKRFDAALALASQLSDAMPEAMYRTGISDLYWQAGKHDQALKTLRENIDEPQTALQWLDRTLRVGKADDKRIFATLSEQTYSPQVWALMGIRAERFEDFALAAKCYRKALVEQPNNAGILNNLAWSLLQSGNYNNSELLRIARDAYRDKPDEVAVADTYVSVLLALNRPGDALDVLKKSGLATRDTPRPLYHLAVAHEQNGNNAKAIECFQRLLKMLTKLDSPPQLPVNRKKIMSRIAALQQKD